MSPKSTQSVSKNRAFTPWRGGATRSTPGRKLGAVPADGRVTHACFAAAAASFFWFYFSVCVTGRCGSSGNNSLVLCWLFLLPKTNHFITEDFNINFEIYICVYSDNRRRKVCSIPLELWISLLTGNEPLWNSAVWAKMEHK